MPNYDVYIYAIARLKVTGIEADSPQLVRHEVDTESLRRRVGGDCGTKSAAFEESQRLAAVDQKRALTQYICR